MSFGQPAAAAIDEKLKIKNENSENYGNNLIVFLKTTSAQFPLVTIPTIIIPICSNAVVDVFIRVITEPHS